MKVRLYADFTCPFSYMGKRRLDEALQVREMDYEFELKAHQLTKWAAIYDKAYEMTEGFFKAIFTE